MTEPGWENLKSALDRRCEGDVAGWLLGASEKHRRANFPKVLAHLRHISEGRWLEASFYPAFGLAVLGCAPTAIKAVAGMRKPGLADFWGQVPIALLLEVFGKREVTWLPELAQQMADRLPVDCSPADWMLVEALVRLSGTPTPTGAAFTCGWVRVVRGAQDPDRALCDGPYTRDLLPMLFEHERIGAELAYTFDGEGFNPALIRLSVQDPSVRRLLLDGCRARLLRAGRAYDLRPYVTLHETLAVTAHEAAAATSDYLGLLSAELSTVAAMAQRMLRMAEEAGLLEPAMLLEISMTMLERREKSLVKNQTSWIRQAAKRYPDHAAELLELIAPTAPPQPALAATEFVPTPVAVLAPPIDSSAELVENLAGLLAGDWSVSTVERSLAALVTLRHRDRVALEAAVTPLVERQYSHWSPAPVDLLRCVLAVMGGDATAYAPWHDFAEAIAVRQAHGSVLNKLGEASAGRGVGRLLEHRLAEIVRYGVRQPVPLLLATPTHRNGHLDPATLLDRLEAAQAGGWQPWPLDLTQALLRLPRQIDLSLTDRARRLTTSAGVRAAEYFDRGHRDPVSIRTVQEGSDSYADRQWGSRLPTRRLVVGLRPHGLVDPVEEALFTKVVFDRPEGPGWGNAHLPEIDAAALPSHGEVVAAWHLPDLAAQADVDSGKGAAAVLPLLAEGDGPVGPATTLAIAYSLLAKDVTDRVAALDAILGFGARLDGSAVGAELGELAGSADLTISRAVIPLQEAARAGATAVVWAICRSLLPALLNIDKPRPGTADLVDLAIECARSLQASDPITEVAQHAARRGSGRLVEACRTLNRLLT